MTFDMSEEERICNIFFVVFSFFILYDIPSLFDHDPWDNNFLSFSVLAFKKRKKQICLWTSISAQSALRV